MKHNIVEKLVFVYSTTDTILKKKVKVVIVVELVLLILLIRNVQLVHLIKL